MENVHPPNVAFGHGYTTSFSLESHLPFGVPWLFGSQTPLEGVAFWYRPDHSSSMPRRPILKAGPDGIGHESVKHRRTRNGCFTCRNRRVKCDEARPVCDRCRKGNRQCEFPPPVKASKRKERSSISHAASRTTGTASEDDESRSRATKESDSEDFNKIPASEQPSIKQEGSGEPSRETEDKPTSHSPSEWNSVSASVTPTSSLQSGTLISSSTVSAPETSPRSHRWAHLPTDLQKFLQYQVDEMTYYHYFFKLDPNDFLHTEFIDLAIEYEPLLYAVVGFAAYHHTLEQSDGKISDFLGYYTKALSLLRESLMAGHKRTPATFLTILQLATFEEYLGDWVHLFGHHRAAYHLLLEIYTPDDIFDTEVGRQIFAWYSRFDVIAGMMSGNATVLGREWYIAYQNYYDDQIDPEDVDVENGLAAAAAATCLIGWDMASLYSSFPKGLITIEDFVAQGDQIAQRLSSLRERLQNLNDDYYTVNEFPDKVPLTSDDIVDPYKAGGLFRDVFWPLNFLWIGFYGIFQMHTLSMLSLLQRPLPPEMAVLSLDQCRILEAVERWPASPKGSLLGCHESLAIAAVFLPKDDKHSIWCRKKFATVSRNGYMFPLTLRQKMAQLWQIPEIHHWWLPNDEGFSPLLQEIRAFSTERMTSDLDETTQKLRDISAVFSGLDIQKQTKI